MHSALISTDVIQTKLDRDDWAIVDTRFYLPETERGKAEHLEAHIPGAVYAHLDDDLAAPRTGSNGRHPMPSLEHMVDRFSQWGIDENVQVVVYDNAGGQFASRLWWMLRYLGHEAVTVLDGSFSSYDGELRGGPESRAPRRFTPRTREAMRIDVEALAPHLDDYLLIDARAGERFRGETEPLDPVAGHIPGAHNLPSGANLDDHGRFLSPTALRQRFESVIGERDMSDVVCYCGSGITACHNLLAMEVAAIRGARLYPGSWSEWCADDTRAVETG